MIHEYIVRIDDRDAAFKQKTEDLDLNYKAEVRLWGKWDFIGDNLFMCTACSYIANADWLRDWKQYTYDNEFPKACPKCGASMSASYRQVTGKLNSESEYKSKVKELEEYIAKCEKAEEEFKKRTCKFRSPTNCDFCSFHSDCEEHWKEGGEN